MIKWYQCPLLNEDLQRKDFVTVKAGRDKEPEDGWNPPVECQDCAWEGLFDELLAHDKNACDGFHCPKCLGVNWQWG